MMILAGIAIIAFGAFMVMKTEMLYQNFGTIPFFDRWLSTEGGGRLGYKLIGIGLIFIGVLTMTNMIGSFITWLFSPLIEWSKPTTPTYSK